VAPSLIETDMARRDLQVDPQSTPIGRLGTPEEVANAVVMLAKTGYITGQTVFVNGGRHMT
jgi:3-oxoacyl-[acyl-carrier protein] reductase